MRLSSLALLFTTAMATTAIAQTQISSEDPYLWLEDVTSEMRARAKTINFATIYGQGARALSLQLKISFAEAKEFIATYSDRDQAR